jgi:hypothetical protein
VRKPRHLYHDSDNAVIPYFNDSQKEFVRSKSPYLCLSGGYGSGKTTALVWRILYLLVDSPTFGDMSGNIGIVGRYRMSDFEKTTLPELWRWLPRQWLRKWWKKDNIIELTNESILHLTHFDAIEHLQSYNAGFAALDQMEQVAVEVWDAVSLERIRNRVLTRFNENGIRIVPKFDGYGKCLSDNVEELASVLNYQCAFGVCNPRPCWIYDRFVKNDNYRKSPIPEVNALYKKDYHLITSSTYENERNLPEDYIERQRRDKSDKEFRRSVMGAWDAFEGQIFEDFSDNLILKGDYIPAPWWKLYVGIDHGGSGQTDAKQSVNITSVTFIAEEKREGTWSKLHVFDELYLPSSTIEETVAAIYNKLVSLGVKMRIHYGHQACENFGRIPIVSAWRGGHDMNRRRGDSDESVMETYMRHALMMGLNMPLSVGETDIQQRIHKMAWLMRKLLLNFNPSCIHAIEAFRNYTYGRDEKPQAGQDDHPVESTSYAASAVDMWWMDFTLPMAKQTIVERELQKVQNQTNNSEYDPIYGRQYAGMA